MINTYTFITPNYKLLSSNGDLFTDLHISFALTDLTFFDKFSLTALHHSTLLLNDNLNFSVYIDLKEEAGINPGKIIQYIGSNRNLLLQFVFHPKYRIISQRPVFCFNEADRDKPELIRLIANLDAFFIDQGYEGILAIYFSENKDKPFDETFHFSFSSNCTSAEISDFYYNLLYKQFYSAKYIAIKSTEIETAIQKLNNAEQEFLKKEPAHHRHLMKYCKLKDLNTASAEKIKLITLDLENQKKYLKILKDGDEAAKINDFYYNEYEILPLWYKKIGHVIKVILGKRTFRSLYDSNIKKYKN